jgi:hypothetical protein
MQYLDAGILRVTENFIRHALLVLSRKGFGPESTDFALKLLSRLSNKVQQFAVMRFLAK